MADHRGAAIQFAGLILLASLSSSATRGDDEAIADPAWLRERLEKVREAHHLPALAAAVVVDGKVVAASAVGVRKWGDPTKATRDDPFHLGSCVKPMTATMVARLVERGTVRWDSTMAELFPELASTMNPAYGKVTVAQQLSHSSGMPYQPHTPESVTDSRGRTLQEKRYEYVKAALADRPEAPAGTKVIYSGGGIIIASALERLTKRSYEDLMHELVFIPLGMTHAGFGSMTRPGQLNVPRDHHFMGSQPVPLDPDPGQVQQARAPVGRNVRCSVIDFARFDAAHITGGPAGFLKPESLRRLHTRVGPVSFGPGWAVGDAHWAKGTVLSHSGSMGYNHALSFVAPDERLATVIMTNIDGEGVGKALDEVNRFLVVKIRRGEVLKPTANAKPAGPIPSKPDVPLDRLTPFRATTGFGQVLTGKTANGSPMTLDGEAIAQGMGTHAPSELVYALKPEYRRFVARVGIDDQQWFHGTIRVAVYIDGRLMASSPVLRGGDPPWPIDIALPGPGSGSRPRGIHLVVGDGGDGQDWDLTDWADAGFVTRDGK